MTSRSNLVSASPFTASSSHLSTSPPSSFQEHHQGTTTNVDRTGSTSFVTHPRERISCLAARWIAPPSSSSIKSIAGITPAPFAALPMAMEPLQREATNCMGGEPSEPSVPSHWIGHRNGSGNAIEREHSPDCETEENEDDGILGESEGGYTPYLGRLTAVACLGGLQFGWDTGIAAGMLVAIHQDLGHTLSSKEQEIIVSATTVGAIVGALTAGRLSDWIGRKRVMVIAGVFFALGSMEQAASQVVRELVLGRILVGLGVGMASMVVPTYLAECAPTSIRGRIVGINSLLITGGQVVAYVVDAAFYHLPHGWRWMVLAGGVPAIVQLAGLIIYLDESPRWLVSKGRHADARHVLSRIYPHASGEEISRHVERTDRSLRGVSHDILPANSSSLSSVQDSVKSIRSQLKELLSEAANRRALILACGLQAGQQLVGANSILYFSSRLLLMAGFKTNPNSAAVAVAVANFMGTVLAMRVVDRWGRRKLLLRTTAAAASCLAGLALALGMIQTGDVVDEMQTLPIEGGEHGAGVWAYISLIAMICFLFFYALGLGIVPWLVQSEVFSGPIRGIGGGLATATNWICNLIISATYLDLVKLITPEGSFWLYSGIAVLTWLFAYFYLPELTGVSINDVRAAFEQHSTVADPSMGRYGERTTADGAYMPVLGEASDEEAEETSDHEGGRGNSIDEESDKVNSGQQDKS